MLTKHRTHLVPLALVLAVGFALRLLQPTLVEFKRDEATIARLGQAIAYEGYLPAVGVDSSLGIDNLPLTLYLAALPLRVWADPLSVVVFTCLLNSLALLVCYWLTRAGLGKTEALLATLFFAVSPWAVLYARKIWSRTLPIFTLAFMVSLFLTFVLRRKWALVAAFVSLAGLLGLQLEALAFVPILGLAILLYRDAVAWRPLLVGIFVFCLLLLPYGVHDARQGWQNSLGLLGYAGGDGVFSWDAVWYALSLLGGQGIEGQAGPFYLQFRQELGPFWWFNHVLSVLLAASLVYGSVEAFRSHDQSRRRTFTLMLLWFFVPVLLQLEPSTPTQRHYYVMHYPVQYMLMGAFLVQAAAWVMRWATAHGRAGMAQIAWGAVAGGLVLGCGWQVLVTAHLRGYMVVHPTTGGYGIPLRYTRMAAAEARALAPNGEIIVLAEDTRPIMTETPTVFDALLFTVPHRFADGRSALPLPQRERVAYIVGPLAPRWMGTTRWRSACPGWCRSHCWKAAQLWSFRMVCRTKRMSGPVRIAVPLSREWRHWRWAYPLLTTWSLPLMRPRLRSRPVKASTCGLHGGCGPASPGTWTTISRCSSSMRRARRSVRMTTRRSPRIPGRWMIWYSAGLACRCHWN